MSSWMEEYLDALEARDAHEKAQEVSNNAYTRLADRHAELNKAVARGSLLPHPDHPDSPASTTPPQPARLPPSVVGSAAPRSTSPSVPKPSTDKATASQTPSISLREDLTAANHTIHSLKSQIASLQSQISTLTSQSSTDSTKSQTLQDRIKRLEADKGSTARKLRDRESELKEKARLVENVQDEMLGLEMQINVAEEKAKALKRENGELVERWMKRIGDEADQMNLGSGWK